MRLVKITHEHVQIKTDQLEFDNIKINDLLQLSDGNATLVASVVMITESDNNVVMDEEFIEELTGSRTIDCNIIGCIKEGTFYKAIDAYPVTDLVIEQIDNKRFKEIFEKYEVSGFELGQYTEYDCPAYVDGNKFFQRHACILGNTGSGKSETVAKILQEAATLKNANIIVFDIHGEYSRLSYVKNIKIGSEVSFPIWMFSFIDIVTNILKVKEESSTVVMTALRKCYYALNPDASENRSCYFDYDQFISLLMRLNNEEIETGEYYKTGDKAGMAKTVKGDYNGKLSNILNSLNDSKSDSRYGFLFEKKSQEYYKEITKLIIDNDKPVKNIDLSELPHDVALMVISTVARLVYEFQRKTKGVVPITFCCEEAHVYIPNNFQLSASQQRMVEIFENIAKEGRKFATTLLPATQRPSELNKTIIAQCANFIVSKLNNENDKSMIKAMLPDGNDKLIDSVTMFNPGEVLVIGDAVPIPLKISVELARERPESRTIHFWDEWNTEKESNLEQLIERYLLGEDI